MDVLIVGSLNFVVQKSLRVVDTGTSFQEELFVLEFVLPDIVVRDLASLREFVQMELVGMEILVHLLQVVGYNLEMESVILFD